MTAVLRNRNSGIVSDSIMYKEEYRKSRRKGGEKQ
jgi:hypothetical protein